MTNNTNIKIHEIHKYMKHVLGAYDKIRGKFQDDFEVNFWDAVVISASDSSQKLAYEKQILLKQQKKELPLNVTFHIFSDKPGFKNGCGGSTMHVLESLLKIYDNALFEMRLLLIPAGGHSQRLPSLSVLGKLFCPLPFGDSFYQMIDLILAAYLPFLKDMPPGVFLASSDAIISYNLSVDDHWTFKTEGFTALAHPSSLEIGVGHGVYVLPKNQDLTKNTFMSDCLKVLQKPTKEKMFENDAVVNFSFEGNGKTDIVFSDSAFFFDYSIVLKLINFYKKAQPLNCELSSYGDFLQTLGLNAEPPDNIKEDTTTEDSNSARSALHRTLYGSKLSLLVLKESQFHHLGTIPEYIDSFCFRNDFDNAFPVSKFSYSALCEQGLNLSQIKGTVIHSAIHPLTDIPECSIVEFCDFDVPIKIGRNCLISNCQYSDDVSVAIPDDAMLHTVFLKQGYATIACSVFDDLKKSYSRGETANIQFFNKALNGVLQCDIDNLSSSNSKQYSLWNTRIFKVAPTMEESFASAVRLVNRAAGDIKPCLHSVYQKDSEITYVSMEDVLSLKDIESMLSFQGDLYQKISKLRENNQALST